MDKPKFITLILICFIFSFAHFCYAGRIDDYSNLSYSPQEEEVLIKALQLAPENYGIYYGLGVAYFKKGDYNKVIECRDKFIQLLKHDYYRAYRNLEAAYRKLGEYKKSMEYSQKAALYAREHPGQPTAFKNDAQRNREVEALANALKVAGGIGARIYIDAVPFYGPGNKEAGQEIEYLERAIEIDPENYGNYYGLGIAYYRMADFEKAADSLFSFMQTTPDCSSTFYGLGIAYNHKGDIPQALEQVKQLKHLGQFQLADALEAAISGSAVNDNSLDSEEVRNVKNYLKQELKNLELEEQVEDE